MLSQRIKLPTVSPAGGSRRDVQDYGTGPFLLRTLRYFLFLVFLAWFFALPGCTAFVVPPDVERVAIPCGASVAPTPLSDTYAARTSLDIRTPRGRIPLTVALVFRYPDLLRIESLPPIGPTDFLLVADGTTLAAYFPIQGKYYTGKATAGNLSRFLPVSFSPRDIVSLLMGRAPTLPEKGATVNAVADGLLCRIDEKLPGGKTRSSWIDPVRKRCVRAEVRSFFGTVEYAAEFLDFAEGDETGIPRRIELTSGNGAGTGVTIRYLELQRTAEGDPSLFVFPAPPEAVVHMLDGRVSGFP